MISTLSLKKTVCSTSCATFFTQKKFLQRMTHQKMTHLRMFSNGHNRNNNPIGPVIRTAFNLMLYRGAYKCGRSSVNVDGYKQEINSLESTNKKLRRSIVFLTYFFPIEKKLLVKYKDHVNWNVISERINFEYIDYIDEFIDFWNWDKFSDEINLSNQIFIDKYIDKLNWNIISERKLSSSFAKKYIHWINWKIYSQFIPLDEICLFETKVNWNVISARSDVSIALLKKYINDFNWTIVSEDIILSTKLLDLFEDKVNWDVIFKRARRNPKHSWIRERYNHKYSFLRHAVFHNFL